MVQIKYDHYLLFFFFFSLIGMLHIFSPINFESRLEEIDKGLTKFEFAKDRVDKV